MIVGDAGTAMMEQLALVGTAFRELFAGEGVFGGTAVFGWNLVTDLLAVLDAAFDLAVTLVLMMLLAMGLVVVFAIGQAQVIRISAGQGS